MKTGKEYFEMLSEVEKEQFKNNLDTALDFDWYMNRRYIDKNGIKAFEYFISGAFGWEQTPEGHEYWERISKRPEQPITTPYKSGIMLGIFIGFFTGTLLTMATRDWTYQLLGLDLLIVAGIVYLYKKYREEQ
jgi:purine-cytosine permease-like protein